MYDVGEALGGIVVMPESGPGWLFRFGDNGYSWAKTLLAEKHKRDMAKPQPARAS